MKRLLMMASLIAILSAGLWIGLRNKNASWEGVDESVVGKFARQAHRPPAEPLINTDQGDVLLFVFLVAGTVGGFVCGYYYRALFGPGSTPNLESKAQNQ